MTAFALVAIGAAVCIATVVLAKRTRARDSTVVDPADPWVALAPRSVEEIDDEARVRLWPIAAFLTGLVFVAGGLVVLQTTNANTRAASVPPTFIEVATPTPDPVPLADVSPDPSPEPTPEPTVTPSPTRTPRVTPRTTPTPKPATPKPSAAPTPKPTPPPPPKPGPNVGASTSCFRTSSTAATINYNVQARDNTTLSTLTILLDGSAVQRPGVRGRTSFTGSHTQEVTAGTHTYRVVATASDGGSTDRAFQVCV